jgi:hypothetical protein
MYPVPTTAIARVLEQVTASDAKTGFESYGDIDM